METKNKKIFFFGTPSIAVPSLTSLHRDPDIEIIGVGVFPDRKVGRKQILTPCPVKQKALDLDLPIYEISNKSELESIVESTDFDLGIVIAFGMIFTDKALTKETQSNDKVFTNTPIINVHFSLLPEYRGASPVQSAIKDGKTTSGIAIQRMVKTLDAGDILFQKSYEIPPHATTSQIFTDYAAKTAQILPEFVHSYLSGKVTPEPQKDTEATFCGKFTKADGAINPENQTASEIYNHYRAFDIFPGIYIPSEKGNIKITQCSREPSNKTLTLACTNNTKLYISELQIPGKQKTSAINAYQGNKDLLNSIHISK